MKKLVLAIVAVFALGSVSYSQMHLGARINDGWGLGAELSFQYGLSDANRIEADLGHSWWGDSYDHRSYTTLSATYQWTFNIVAGFGWFVGPGAQIGLYNRAGSAVENESYLRLAAVGQIGLEYEFDFPLQLTLDVRPGFDVLHASDGFVYSYAFGVRYRF